MSYLTDSLMISNEKAEHDYFNPMTTESMRDLSRTLVARRELININPFGVSWTEEMFSTTSEIASFGSAVDSNEKTVILISVSPLDVDLV